MAEDKKRITFEQAKALYPDEWVVFIDPQIDMTNTTFIDGVVYHHGKDRDLAIDKCGEVDGETALEFTGNPRYRRVTLSTDAEGKSNPKAA